MIFAKKKPAPKGEKKPLPAPTPLEAALKHLAEMREEAERRKARLMSRLKTQEAR